MKWKNFYAASLLTDAQAHHAEFCSDRRRGGPLMAAQRWRRCVAHQPSSNRKIKSFMSSLATAVAADEQLRQAVPLGRVGGLREEPQKLVVFLPHLLLFRSR